MSEEKVLTPREQAIKVLQEGGSVVIDRVVYTLVGNQDTGAKSVKDLPKDEDFAKGDAVLTAQAKAALENQLKELQSRYDAMASDKAAKSDAKASKADDKAEVKEEASK